MKEKIIIEQFLDAVDAEHWPFVEEMHSYLLESGCKVTFEEKKSGYLASYKRGKPLRALANFVFRKNGMLVRIYGEHVGGYGDFLNTLPAEMVKSIEGASLCKQLDHGGCSDKCRGYDFAIGGERFQKCRYDCFEFLVTDQSSAQIKAFLENELRERAAV